MIRVFVMATVALTFLLSLGSMLRPIQEYGVGPSQAVHLLGYTIPIILTVVLPMSALFATALTYGRFASDNELDACRASGVSLLTLIYPAMCLAVAVAIANLVLSFYVVPAFVKRAEKSVQGNAKQIVFRNIQRQGFYEMPGERFRIYADEAIPETDTLLGVVALESKGNDITKMIFADTARVIIETDDDYTQVTVIAENARHIDKNENPDYFKSFSSTHRLPPMLSDNIKFQKIDRLKQIRADMFNFEPTRKYILDATSQLAAELLEKDISENLHSKDDNYYQLVTSDSIIRFTASDCQIKDDKEIELQPPISLTEYDPVSRRPKNQWSSDDTATLSFENEQLDSKLGLELLNASWQNERLKSFTPLQQKIFSGITMPRHLAAELNSYPPVQVVDMIGSEETQKFLKNPSNKLIQLKKQAEYRMWRTSKRIIAEIHTRLVFGIGSITLVLFATALGIIFKGGHTLSAFGASAIPAGILVVFMMSGRELTKTVNTSLPESAGVMVMWSGLALLTIIAFIFYRRLMRT